MKTKQQELIDFAIWFNFNDDSVITDTHINDYMEHLKSINSNSAGERRAIGSNEQAGEVCDCDWHKLNRYKHFGEKCIYCDKIILQTD